DPDFFLGGSMPLEVDAAREALDRLGASLGGIDSASAARGVLRYAVSEMAHALRLVTVRRGHDPRDFAFVAYGGAGPLDAASLATIRGELDRRSDEAYAFSLPGDAEVVAGRVTAATGSGDVPWPAPADGGRHELAPRPVDFDQHGGVVTAKVLDRASL